MSERLARVPRVAEILDVKKARVYELVRENFFPPGVVIKLGKRQIRFNEDALREFIARGGEALSEIYGDFALTRTGLGERANAP